MRTRCSPTLPGSHPAPGARCATRLETIARIASAEEVGALDFPWWLLRYQHAEAIRAKLAEGYAPATANKMLSAMKGVLKSSLAIRAS